MKSYWYKPFPQYPRGHMNFWRVRLILHILLISTVMFTIVAAINFIVFSSIELGLLDSVGTIVSLGIYAWFRKTGNVALASWMITTAFTALVMYFIFMVNGTANSFMWAILIPPISYFLLGKNWGTVFSAIIFGFCCYIAYQLYDSQPAVEYSLGSFLNIVEVSVALLLMFRFYEGTRSDAYRELSYQNQKIQLLAETDKLTGLFNREKFDQYLINLMSSNDRSKTSLSLLLLDVDHFKKINDSKGHLEGDKILKGLAEVLRNRMRPNDLLARWGGEEFVVVLPDTQVDNAKDFAERLRAHVEQNTIVGVNVSVSIGVTQLTAHDNIDALLFRADQALYKAKNKGRNRVEVISP
jgi:diguanylate cyclase (GGDEF)-like protein